MSGLWNFKLSRKAMAPFFPRALSKSSKCPRERDVLADRVLSGLRHEGLGVRGEPGASGGGTAGLGRAPWLLQAPLVTGQHSPKESEADVY